MSTSPPPREMQSSLAGFDHRLHQTALRQSTSSLRYTASPTDPVNFAQPHFYPPSQSALTHSPLNTATIQNGAYSNSFSTLSNYDGSRTYGVSGFSHRGPVDLARAPRSMPSNIPFPPTLNTSSTGRASSSHSPVSPSSPLSPASPKGSTPQKTYKCEICNMAFTRAHDRKRHYSTHNRPPDGGPKCEWCHKSFSRGDALKRHMDNGCDYMPDHEYELRQSHRLQSSHRLHNS